MNQIVIIAVRTGTCPMCAGKTKMQIRRPAVAGRPGGFAGWVDCPLCVNPDALVKWVEPYAEPVMPPEVIA